MSDTDKQNNLSRSRVGLEGYASATSPTSPREFHTCFEDVDPLKHVGVVMRRPPGPSFPLRLCNLSLSLYYPPRPVPARYRSSPLCPTKVVRLRLLVVSCTTRPQPFPPESSPPPTFRFTSHLPPPPSSCSSSPRPCRVPSLGFLRTTRSFSLCGASWW